MPKRLSAVQILSGLLPGDFQAGLVGIMKNSKLAYVTNIELLPEKRLANAAIMQAVLDYRCALITVRKHPEDNNAKRMVFECERFFRSKAFGIYCDLDGEALMYKIQDEVDERSTRR